MIMGARQIVIILLIGETGWVLVFFSAFDAFESYSLQSGKARSVLHSLLENK